MTTRSQLNQLVNDTLFDRRANTGTTCLTTNAAGIELLGCSTEVLEVIENVIQEVIVPQYNQCENHNQQFVGLAYVLGAYLQIGLKSEFSRVIEFLRRLPRALFIDTLSVVPIFFGNPKDERSVKQLPSDEFLTFLRSAKEAQDADIREVAARVLFKIGGDAIMA